MSKPINPPRWADRFLKWYCSDELLEEIQGDLHEAFRYRAQHFGISRARWMFIVDVLKFFKPYSFEKHSRSKQFLPMFDNYLKIAFRNIPKKKGFTALNLVGLSVGITTVLFVSIYLFHETTYDRVHPSSDQIFRLVNHHRDQMYCPMFFDDYYQSSYETQIKLVNKLRSYEEVDDAAHFVPSSSAIGGGDKYYLNVGERRLIVDDILYTNTGPSFQEIFPQKFLLGSPEYAFYRFDNVVLTEEMAIRVYGKDWREQDIIGTEIKISDESFLVGGVIENVQGNVHYTFDLIVHQERIPSWGAYTYIRLAKGSDIEKVVGRLNREVDQVYPGYTEDVLQNGIQYVKLHDIHITDGMLYELKAVANPAYLRTFGVIGIVILLIIWTNYTNLSIAMYAGRQKELGVRKVLGAQSLDISLQILVEAVLLTLLCLPLSWLMVYILLPQFSVLMELNIDQGVLFQPFTLVFFGGILLLTGIISSFYPALVFSRKSMISLFESKLSKPSNYRYLNFRNGLLMLQFFMLVGLISVTIVIQKQMDFVQSKELGFVKEGVLYFGLNGVEKYKQLRDQLSGIPEIMEMGTGEIPGQEMYNQLTYKMKDTDVTLSDGTHLYTSFDMLKTLQIQCEPCLELEKGKEQVFVINETAAKKLAAIKNITTTELIGETLVTEPEWENDEYGYGVHYKIAGIIDDFNYFSLKYQSQTLLLEVIREPSWVYNMAMKVRTDDWMGTLGSIEAAYNEVEKRRPFDPIFLEDHLNQLYSKEKNAGILASGLSAVAVILAVLGLVGVVGFITLKRQKEIGIRKVFGASVRDILVMINKEYTLIIAISTGVAIPVSMYFADSWLQSFAYRIDPDFWLVLIAGFCTLLLVVVVVVIQSYKSARINPSDSLRYE